MQLQNGVQLQIIQTDKFKDIGISFRFLTALDKREAGIRSLLALMLCDRSVTYDTKKKMSDYQDTLYGATLNAQTAGYGAGQIIEIRSKMIHPNYIDQGASMLGEWIQFLNEILFRPLLSNEVFEESKSILCAKIERMQDDPAQCAITQGLQYAGGSTPLGISALGDLTFVKEIKLDDVIAAYKNMIHENEITIVVCGDVDDLMEEKIVSAFPFAERNSNVKTYYCVENEVEKDMVYQYRDITQSSIMMTWFTNTNVIDQDYYPLRVANAMLGQYSTSMLFQEVREKHSLCYSIFSNLIAYDGALGVTTGVEKAKITKTIDLIKEQFRRLSQGEFEDSLLEVSKRMIVNSLKASKDSMNSLMALSYQNNLLHKQDTTEDIITLVNAVSKEDVLRAINKCELKVTFVLTKEDENEKNN